MAISKLGKAILSDIEFTIAELRQMNLVRDESGISQHSISSETYELSFSGRNDANKIMYDKHISCSHLMDTLLKSRQYTLLLYDKSIIQAEFIICGNNVIKERLVFIKKHNKVWNKNEIDECDANDEDWFSDEEGIPIVVRVDFDPEKHQECRHAVSHLTLANHESCRIPMKEALSFSEFVSFVMFHFYDVSIDKRSLGLCESETITREEKQMLHVSW